MTTVAEPVTRPLIEAGELKEYLDSGKPVTILDARSAKAWAASPSRIPGEVRIDPEAFEANDAWPKDRLTVAYCTRPDERASARVAQTLRQKGFEQAYALHGGFAAWQAAGGATQWK